METSKLPDMKFKTLVIRILNELRGKIDEGHGNHRKEPVRNEGYIN